MKSNTAWEVQCSKRNLILWIQISLRRSWSWCLIELPSFRALWIVRHLEILPPLLVLKGEARTPAWRSPWQGIIGHLQWWVCNQAKTCYRTNKAQVESESAKVILITSNISETKIKACWQHQINGWINLYPKANANTTIMNISLINILKKSKKMKKMILNWES